MTPLASGWGCFTNSGKIKKEEFDIWRNKLTHLLTELEDMVSVSLVNMKLHTVDCKFCVKGGN